MLTLNNVIVSYGSHEVIHDLKLSVNCGIIHGLIGLNGSGKSTLLHTIAGILKQKNGTVIFNEKFISNKQVALLETEPFFYSSITGREYLKLFKPEQAHTFNIDEWANLFNIPLDELIDGYSTGMKKKLAIIGVFKTDRDVILLDEPFNGLDLESSRILSTLLPKLISANKIIIVTSHILDTLKGMCGQIHYLNNGKIQRSFSSSELDEIEKVVFHDLDKEVEIRINKITKTI
jgi:ABC-2 type transport system ATP-binding protein